MAVCSVTAIEVDSVPGRVESSDAFSLIVSAPVSVREIVEFWVLVSETARELDSFAEIVLNDVLVSVTETAEVSVLDTVTN